MWKNGVFRTRFGFVVGMIAFLVAFMVPATPSEAQATVAAIGVSPNRGYAGNTVTVSGSGYSANGTPATISWDGVSQGNFDITQGGAFSRNFVIPKDAGAGGHTITVCASSGASCANTVFTVALGVNSLPSDLQRRLAQFLAEMRGGPMALRWTAPRPSGFVMPLYRPDVDGVAYYEVDIVNQVQGPGTQAFIPAVGDGFVILSTGAHDFPIGHWADSGFAPSRVLQGQTTTALSRVYKLDTLAYAGEDEKGNLVTTLGQQPAKISGLDTSFLTRKDGLATNELKLNQPVPDDSSTTVISGTVTRTGAGPLASLKIENWDSWAALKSGFKTTYGVLLEDVKQQAAVDWAIETGATRDGEALRKGDVYDLSLLTDSGANQSLGTTPTVTINGAGKNLVSGSLVSPSGQAPIFRITVLDSLPNAATPFTADIDYGGGKTESVKFLVIRSGNQVALPLITGGGTAQSGQATNSAAPRGATVQGPWGAWTYFFAGTSSDQRLYSQMNSGSAPNTSGCYSGCGATAWAMLFGWADYQASLNRAPWTPRKGLYRENGGYGTDAVAPITMDTGVRNMTWEIRNRIGTFCAFGSGATFPWNMSSAAGYLAGRSGTGLRTDYNVLGIHTDGLRERARDSIIRGTPAIIGTGWLSHYPLAYGYAWRSRETRSCIGPDLGFNCWNSTEYSRWFYVNQGWGGSGNGWVSAGTWFAGQIFP